MPSIIILNPNGAISMARQPKRNTLPYVGEIRHYAEVGRRVFIRPRQWFRDEYTALTGLERLSNSTTTDNHSLIECQLEGLRKARVRAILTTEQPPSPRELNHWIPRALLGEVNAKHILMIQDIVQTTTAKALMAHTLNVVEVNHPLYNSFWQIQHGIGAPKYSSCPLSIFFFTVLMLRSWSLKTQRRAKSRNLEQKDTPWVVE